MDPCFSTHSMRNFEHAVQLPSLSAPRQRCFHQFIIKAQSATENRFHLASEPTDKATIHTSGILGIEDSCIERVQ